jgi:tRNA U34 5-methylaminomethyl-2-thiouridine-forming methyltransferase MnmC
MYDIRPKTHDARWTTKSNQQHYFSDELKQLIITSDGSHTIYIPELDEHYHSIHGAVQESEFIFLKCGFDFCTASPLNILEVGFGTGLNALLTAIRCIKGNRKVNYTSIEKYPVDEKTILLLNYNQFAGEEGEEVFNSIHSSPWNTNVNICKNFNLTKTESDLTKIKPQGEYDLIYFDAFGPDKQPEMWTKEIFYAIASVTKTNGVFVTYSAKGEVKRNLRACGFEVTLLPGPPGKRQITRAVKI